jgi:hypothetical protein
MPTCRPINKARINDEPAYLRAVQKHLDAGHHRLIAWILGHLDLADHKRCSSCGMSKPTTDFSKNRTTPDGLSYHCRRCRANREHRYRARKRARSLQPTTIRSTP